MRKITFFLSLLLTLAGVTSASAQAWRPTQRATTLSADKKYMLYNTTITDTDDRTGFLCNNGSGLGHSGSPKQKPATFVATSEYLWTLETSDTEYLYYMKSVSSNTYVGPAGVTNNTDRRNLYIQPWTTSQAPKAGVSSEKADGTVAANSDISAEDYVFTICGTGLTSNGQANGNGDCWNGNPDTWAKWASSHPYAFYEVEEVHTAEEMAAYNAAKEKLNNAAFSLQSTYGLVTSADQYTSNATQPNEGSIANLLDGTYSSYFHTKWGEAVGEDHYLQAELPDLTSDIRFYFKKRSDNNNNRPTQIQILGSTDGTSFTEVTTINNGLPTNATVLDYYSEIIHSDTPYKYYRFVVKATNNGALDNQYYSDPKPDGHPFFTFSEFYILPGDNTLVNGVLNARNTINSLSLSAENFNTVVSECAAAYTNFENATKTVTINHQYDGKVFYTTEATALQGKTVTYTSDVTRYGLTCDEPTKTITVGADNNVVAFTYSRNDEVIPFETTAEFTGTFPADTKWYYLTQRGKYCRYDATDSKIKNTAGDRDFLLYRDLFAFTGDPGRGYKIYNYAAGATKIVGGDNVTTDAHVTMMNDAESQRFLFECNNGHFVFRKAGTDLGYLNDIKGTLGYWVSNAGKTDAGSTFDFVPVNTDDMAQIPVNEIKAANPDYLNIYNRINGTVIGTGFNEYTSTADATSYAAIRAQAIEAWNGTDAEALSTAMTAAAAAFEGQTFTLNMPSTGTFLRMKGSVSGNYVSNGISANSRISMDTDPNTAIFYYSPENRMVNYSTGKSIALSSEAWNWSSITTDESSVVSILASNNTKYAGRYFIKFAQATTANNNAAIYDGETEVNRGSRLDIETNQPLNYTWYLEPVTALPVNIGSAGFATLWAPVALEIPAGVTAYTATLDEAESTLTLEEVSGVIPANTGVVLKAVADNYDFNITTTENTASSSLTGQVNTIGYDKTTTDSKVYTLQTIEEGTVGFKAYSGTKLSGFKARLETNAEIQQALRLVFGGTTGIGSVATDGDNAGTVFDLSGRRVAAPAKGIYIVNGKKVIFK